VAVHEEVANGHLAQQLVDARHVAALAQPHAGGATAEVLFVEIRRRVYLRAQRGPVAVHEREEGVSGGRRDHLEPALILQATEGAHQVALVAAPGVAQAEEAIVVHLGQAVVLRLRLGPLQLLLGQQDQIVQVVGVPGFEQVVGQHADERRGQRNRAAVGHAVCLQTLEDLDERKIGSADGFVQPLFFHHRRIFGVTDEGQMGVQDQRKVSGWHGAYSLTGGLEPIASGEG
jgi:hypothetical protein